MLEFPLLLLYSLGIACCRPGLLKSFIWQLHGLKSWRSSANRREFREDLPILRLGQRPRILRDSLKNMPQTPQTPQILKPPSLRTLNPKAVATIGFGLKNSPEAATRCGSRGELTMKGFRPRVERCKVQVEG